MPEVVEVYITSKYLDSIIKHKFIKKIEIVGGRYKKKPINNLDYINTLLPLEIISIKSKGKFMYIELYNKKNNKTIYLANTYGLTGQWSLVESKHSNFRLILNDLVVYYTDQLGFGTIDFMDKFKLDTKLKSLADDVLNTNFTNKDLYNKLQKVNPDKTIIEVLMQQKDKNSLFSGIGNYLSVEILYHSKISPYSTIKGLLKNKTVCKNLAFSIKYVVKLSLFRSDIGYISILDDNMQKFIKKFRSVENYDLYHPEIKFQKEIFSFNVYGRNSDPYGNEVIKDKIIKGRTTYWCPIIQINYK